MDLIFSDVMTRITKNPLILMKMASMETKMLATDRRFVQNCRELRYFIGQIIDEKKASKVSDPTDFLEVLL